MEWEYNTRKYHNEQEIKQQRIKLELLQSTFYAYLLFHNSKPNAHVVFKKLLDYFLEQHTSSFHQVPQRYHNYMYAFKTFH